VRAERGRIILDPGAFYILVSREAVHIPPGYAAEMAPYLAMVGEFRVHYAGFFDPGFGHAAAGGTGARGVLEVRCHEAPFALDHGQVVGRLVFERMLEYAKQREAFGQRIGTYQFVQQHVVDSLLEIKMVRNLVYEAADDGERRALQQAMVQAAELDVARVVVGKGDPNRQRTLSADEGTYLVHQLARRGDWESLWGLVPSLPLDRVVDAVQRIESWEPSTSQDRTLFEAMRVLNSDVWQAAQDELSSMMRLTLELPGTQAGQADQARIRCGRFSRDGTRLVVAADIRGPGEHPEGRTVVAFDLRQGGAAPRVQNVERTLVTIIDVEDDLLTVEERYHDRCLLRHLPDGDTVVLDAFDSAYHCFGEEILTADAHGIRVLRMAGTEVRRVGLAALSPPPEGCHRPYLLAVDGHARRVAL
jgi:hypothetical protein